MIYYNNSNINDWNFGDDNIIKVYKHGAVCYYKITTSGGTSGQTPCFAVVDDITQYSDTEFEDVYDKATEKWYKLNNLNQYEEYGVYGSGRTICEGSTSRLPQGYTEVEYIENTSTAYINLGVNPYSANGNSFIVESTFSSFTQSSLAYLISTEYTNSPYYGFILRWANNNLQLDGGSIGIDTTATNIPNGDGTSAITFYSYSTTTSNNNTPITLFCGLNGSSPWRNGKGKCYSFKLTINNNIVRDLVPCKRDSDDKYGMYDIVNDVFYVSPNNIDFSGGEPITPTDCVTTYEGKLTIDDGYEYIYSGGSWVNVGEVSGSTQIIKSPEYIEKDSSHNGKINLGYVWKTNSKMQFKLYSTNNGGGSMIGEDAGLPDNNDCRMFFASTTAYFDWGSSRISWSSNGRTNTLYEYEYGNYYIKNMVTSASKTGSTISTSRTNPLYLGHGNNDRFRTYYLKFYDGDTLVKDFIPWTDMNGNYGLFDKVSLSVYNVSSGSLTGSSNVTDVEVGGGYEYPLEYPVIQDPPDNLVFSSMAEAESYECPWVGMRATIDGDKYIFSGDSQSGYEWVYNPSRLPVGYTEVEYVQNTGTSYFDTDFKPNTNTRIVADMQQVTANDFPRLFGCNNWNATAGMNVNYEGSYLQISWFGKTSWTKITSIPNNFDRHVYDLNKNNLYVDETLVASTTYSSSYQSSDNLGIFFEMANGRPGQAAYFTQEAFKGKMYSFQIYDNGTLVRDLVPCIRDNDNTVGAYDIVNDVFYTVPTGYTTDKLIAGNPV